MFLKLTMVKNNQKIRINVQFITEYFASEKGTQINMSPDDVLWRVNETPEQIDEMIKTIWDASGRVSNGGSKMSERCKCENYCRSNSKILTKHHKHCTQYDPEGDAREVILALLKSMELWGAEEDGIPEFCWDIYRDANCFIGRLLNVKEAI